MGLLLSVNDNLIRIYTQCIKAESIYFNFDWYAKAQWFNFTDFFWICKHDEESVKYLLKLSPLKNFIFCLLYDTKVS